jgi:hypothetical protein
LDCQKQGSQIILIGLGMCESNGKEPNKMPVFQAATIANRFQMQVKGSRKSKNQKWLQEFRAELQNQITVHISVCQESHRVHFLTG